MSLTHTPKESIMLVILSAAKDLSEDFRQANGNKTEMFESLASCFAFRCSASLNMTDNEFGGAEFIIRVSLSNFS